MQLEFWFPYRVHFPKYAENLLTLNLCLIKQSALPWKGNDAGWYDEALENVVPAWMDANRLEVENSWGISIGFIF